MNNSTALCKRKNESQLKSLDIKKIKIESENGLACSLRELMKHILSLSVDEYTLGSGCILNNIACFGDDKRELLIRLQYCIDLKFSSVFDQDGRLPVHTAVLNDDLSLLRRQSLVLSQRGLIDILDKRHLSALQYAVMKCSVPCVEMLLSYNANPLLQDYEYRSCFHHAVTSDSVHCLEYLINYIMDNATSVLVNACLDRSEAMLLDSHQRASYLLTYINTMTDCCGDTPVMRACLFGAWDHGLVLLERLYNTSTIISTSGLGALRGTLEQVWRQFYMERTIMHNIANVCMLPQLKLFCIVFLILNRCRNMDAKEEATNTDVKLSLTSGVIKIINHKQNQANESTEMNNDSQVNRVKSKQTRMMYKIPNSFSDLNDDKVYQILDCLRRSIQSGNVNLMSNIPGSDERDSWERSEDSVESISNIELFTDNIEESHINIDHGQMQLESDRSHDEYEMKDIESEHNGTLINGDFSYDESQGGDIESAHCEMDGMLTFNGNSNFSIEQCHDESKVKDGFDVNSVGVKRLNEMNYENELNESMDLDRTDDCVGSLIEFHNVISISCVQTLERCYINKKKQNTYLKGILNDHNYIS